MNKTLHITLLIILLILIPLQAVPGTLQESMYGDEAYNIASGYSKLKTFDYRLQPENGPLTPMIAAVPLLFMNVSFPFDDASWKIKDMDRLTYIFLFDYNPDPYRIVFAARFAMIALSMLLGFFVYKWAKELYGDKAGLFALFLYAFSTDMLAHGSIVSSDFGEVVFVFIAGYYFWRFLKEPTPLSLLASGIALGLAQLTKFTVILLFPIFCIIAFFKIFSTSYNPEKLRYKIPDFLRRNGKLSKAYHLVISLILIFLLTYLVILVGYKFEGLGTPIAASMRQDIHLNKTLYPVEGFTGSSKLAGFVLEKVPSPVPYYYARGLGVSFYRTGESIASYVANGEAKVVWYFFLLAFLAKTPIPLLIILLLVIFHALLSKKAKDDSIFLLMPFIIFHAAFLLITKQFGYRYVLPAIPFLFVYAAKILNIRFRRRLFWGAVIVLLSLWYAFSAICIYPNYLSYFNEFAGGPSNGYHQFVDSNTDWGQDLFFLRDYLHKNNISSIQLSYYGYPITVRQRIPDYYRINYTDLGCNPTEGIVAISVTNLMRDKACYGWLQQEQPAGRAGYSILIYNITSAIQSNGRNT